MSKITNLNPIGEDAIKGGIFFGSALTPAGTFSNIPRFMNSQNIDEREPVIMLTLQKIKDSLKSNLQEETGGEVEEVDVEKFLYEFTNLLIDYRDLRNYTFFGSANTEIAYNIKKIVNNFPYKTLIGQKFSRTFIEIRNFIENNKDKTEIIFPEKFHIGQNLFEDVILDNHNKFNFYDSNPEFNWLEQEVVDKNGRRYPIKRVISPFKSVSNFKILAIDTVTITSYNLIPFNTIKLTTDIPHNYTEGMQIDLYDFKCTDPTKELLYKVGSGGNYYSYPLNNEKFIVERITSNELFLRRVYTSTPYEDIELEDYGLTQVYNDSLPGGVRLFPLENNPRTFSIKIIIDGTLTYDSFMVFNLETEAYNGFIISPKISVINDFDLDLTPIQKMLLSPKPINPTPWPRREITDNIQNITEGIDVEPAFLGWLKDPNSLYLPGEKEIEDMDYGQDLYNEYSLSRALALDEVHSNQLIRRCIPQDIISEINDTEDFYFQRFIMIAGWFFDQVRVYVKFIKFIHTINHTEFDQLSPEYYRHYADYYGLELFNDDSIDFTKLVVKTSPGQYFLDTPEKVSNKYLRTTLLQQQHNRQKKLLLSLLFLYRTKGTQNCIKQLIGLLGAPDGFLSINEYAFQVNNLDEQGYPKTTHEGIKIVDNNKVHTPDQFFEIDPDALLDKTNINNPINQPYVYRKVLSNAYTHNLREISINTDPNQAIDNQIINVFGKQKYNYIKFNKGEFANLQKEDDFYLLPLSLPDKFYGLSAEYMIPLNGYKKGIGTDQEEASVNLFSLYNISDIPSRPIIPIIDINIINNSTTAVIEVSNPHNYVIGEKIFISNASGIIGLNNKIIPVQNIIDPNTFEITGDFSGVWGGGGVIISGELPIINPNGEMSYTYPLAPFFNNSNKSSDVFYALDSNNTPVPDGYTNPDSDFNLLKTRFPDSQYLDTSSYIINRIEGNDLVIRLRIKSEVSGLYGERCAIFQDIFYADGLNHTIRLIFRKEGVEVYKDYTFLGIAKWINISHAGPYKAYEIPKSEIKDLQIASDNCFNYYEEINPIDFIANPGVYNTGLDKITWWDLFIGMPNNLDIYFKKINFFENNAINDYNIGDRIVDVSNKTSEFYLFEIAKPNRNFNYYKEELDFNVNCVFYEKLPNYLPEYYGYALPKINDQFNRSIINGLGLSNKRIYDTTNNTLFINKQQDFFNTKDVFSNRAWRKDVHKSYNYNLFDGEVNRLYNLYASQVLTYNALEEFLNLIENKFKKVIQQFIPIVINIQDFGRLIKNSVFNQSKNRIPGNDKVCAGVNINPYSLVMTTVFNKYKTSNNAVVTGQDFSFKIMLTGWGDLIPLTLITWDTNKTITLEKVKNEINTFANNNNLQIFADIHSDVLRIRLDFDWCSSNFGVGSNAAQFIVTQNTNIFINNFQYGFTTIMGIHDDVFDNCGDLIIPAYNDSDVCGSVQYSLPNNPESTTYVYYESEDLPPIFPVFDGEPGNDALFIKKAQE